MITIQTEDFDCGEEYQQLRRDSQVTGAIVTFTGLVRDFSEQAQSQHLWLEHYAGMTEKVLESIVTEAEQRWSIQKVRVIHRVGELHSGDQIVFVGVASRHRKDAFSAAEFIMDFLKTQAPFWKKEVADNEEQWVDAKLSDQHEADRWQNAPPT